MNLNEAMPFWVVVVAVGFLLAVLGAGIVFVKKHPKANKEKEK
ncbi:MAG: hypothetical protein AB7D29_05985 [Campylobacterales bacterium]